MHITALAGGVGGARFIRGLRHHLDTTPGLADSTVTVIANTGDDITLFGLRVCPDVDTLLYTLGDGVHEGQGWGRADESHRVQGELAAYGAVPQWFALGDLDFGTHVVRSQWLGQGASLSEVTARLAARWGLPEKRIELVPMTDVPVETHVVVDDGEGGERAIHFQEWWVRHQAAVPAHVASSSPGSTGPPPHRGCSTRSVGPTSCCCPRATRSCRSASSSACRACEMRCAAPLLRSSGSRPSSPDGRCAATPTRASRRSGSRHERAGGRRSLRGLPRRLARRPRRRRHRPAAGPGRGLRRPAADERRRDDRAASPSTRCASPPRCPRDRGTGCRRPGPGRRPHRRARGRDRGGRGGRRPRRACSSDARRQRARVCAPATAWSCRARSSPRPSG